MMNSAITQAKIGRSIKKRAINLSPIDYWRVLPGPAAAPAAGEPACGVSDDGPTVVALAPLTFGAAAALPAVAGAEWSVCGVQATGCTGVPGGSICSFWKPSTMTFSPSFRP